MVEMHQLDNLLSTISERHALPSIVYHYTDIRGLLGIIESNEMWATDIQYLNDAAEFNYAKNLIHKKFRKLFRNEKNANKTLDGFVNRSQIINEYQIFVCSFSEMGNLLSQWRAYCPNNNGFSVGFDLNIIMSILKKRKNNDFFLAPCIYDDNYQNELLDELKKGTLKDLIEVMEDQIENEDNRDYQLFNEKYHKFSKMFLFLCSIIKHPAFQEEKEWRLFKIIKRHDGQDLNYRCSSSTLIPYTKFDFSSNLHDNPISEIFIGPNPHKKLAKNSLNLLSSTKMLNFKILDSRIPYRAI